MDFEQFKRKLGQDIENLDELLAIVDGFHRAALLPGNAFVNACDMLEKEDCQAGGQDREYESWLAVLRRNTRRVAWAMGAKEPIHFMTDASEDEEGNRISIFDVIASSASTPEELLQKKEELLQTGEIARLIDLVVAEMEGILKEHSARFRAIKRLEILSPQTGKEKKWLATCIRSVEPIYLQDRFRQQFHRWQVKFNELFELHWNRRRT